MKEGQKYDRRNYVTPVVTAANKEQCHPQETWALGS
jgi:hypothetical protein